MMDHLQQIESLDISLFDAIPSQTSAADRHALLAVQRAVAGRFKTFAYLEIGSHLGGSIQPYLLDNRCHKIYSIDPRPMQQPDDRGYVAHYEDNSAERMLSLLKAIGHGDLQKIECINKDASEIEPAQIKVAPEVVFIDGEHTKEAVLSDFIFCEKVVSKSGVILFHDFYNIFPAIGEICKSLRQKGRRHIALKLDHNVFGIFFDRDTIDADAHLASLYKRNSGFLDRFLFRYRLKQVLPGSLFDAAKVLYNKMMKTNNKGDSIA